MMAAAEPGGNQPPEPLRQTQRRRILFVAREPDETLRAFLPVIRRLVERGWRCQVLFHHQPGAWALERLAEAGATHSRVELPAREHPPGLAGRLLARVGLGPEAEETWQLWRARQLARQTLPGLNPAAVVVVQDTLLFERFVVREANRRGRGTLVVQWAFTFPQRYYDQLQRIKQAGGLEAALEAGEDSVPAEAAPRPRRPLTARLVQAVALRALGLRFSLANSYGGGEARVFAVIGEVFREQFLQQGVRKERIEVVGHPLHDAAFAERQRLDAARRAALRVKFGLPAEALVVLYATQPVLWRAVVTPAQLEANVRAIAEAVRELGPDALLALKLHPRETPDQYAFLDGSGLPVRVIQQAEMAELIGAADVFVSSSSSTVLLAMMLDCPILTVNFNRVPHFDLYREVGGTLHVTEHAAFAASLRAAAGDEATRTRLARERARVLARYARFDGRATERLADLVEELARPPR